jgi:NhaP-type Na+/H+ or K+/H+ antiporter
MQLALLIIGLVLVGMALAGSVLKRLPLTASMFYLVVGVLIGPAGLGLLDLEPIAASALLEHVTEIAVIISLFAAGLKLRPSLSDPAWRLPLLLAIVAMAISVGLVTAAGFLLLGLPLGAAVLLGGVLAPTDPVLASDVQVNDAQDRDRLRFALTGEAGLNDGTAFPFVMLGLGLLGLHDLGPSMSRWWTIDVAWAVVAGLAIGAMLGTLVGQLVLYLRRQHKEAVGLDDFLTLGLIALSYALALFAHAYGFLAVFAAGLALRRIERTSSGDRPPDDVVQQSKASPELATHPQLAPNYMAEAVLGFNEQLERMAEVAVVVLLGSMLSFGHFTWEAFWLAMLLMLAIRPVSVLASMFGTRATRLQKGLICWFGIRGAGSLYYLMVAIQHGLPVELAERLTSLTLVAVSASIVLHGISVTPLMSRYQQVRRRERR